MTYWLHRISHEAKHSGPLLERGKLTIGFSDLSTQDFLDKATTARSVDDHDLKMDVKKAYGISRAKYADRALTARMKIRITNVGISDLSENVERALNAYRDGKPIALRSRTPELAEQLLYLIYNELNPGKFESLLKWYFRRIGASDVCTPQKNSDDGDADIRASFDRARLTICVQAKFHDPKTSTDDWAVQQVRDYVQQDRKKEPDQHSVEDVHTTGLWVVSTGKCFTDACMKEAREHDVVLINGIQFAHMLLEAGLESLDI